MLDVYIPVVDSNVYTQKGENLIRHAQYAHMGEKLLIGYSQEGGIGIQH